MTGYPEPWQLLKTKLYRPRPARDLVERTRLRGLLNARRDVPLTLICAPAGFGKTTLLSDWLETNPNPSAWLSLDRGDSDLGVFLTYFVAAINSVFPDACSETRRLLIATASASVEPLVTALANDLDRLATEPALAGDRRFILVLDDYHLVGGQAVHSLLNELLRHPPRPLALVISTRQDPPFPLHTLRGRGELREVRSPELRFTADEAAEFIRQTASVTLDVETVDALAARTEGWATGLRLAAMTLSAGGDMAGAISGLDDNRYVTEYLMNEVLARIPVATQEFLVRTSILERCCGPLCDALAPPADPAWDGRAVLEWLAAENIFVFALDAQNSWYRYHHLFQRLLRNRLERQSSPQALAELHSRASSWFAQNGLVTDAIRHAQAAGDDAAIVRAVEGRRHKAMNREDWRQLEDWLSIVPRRLVDERPELQLLEAWILQKQWKYADIQSYLDPIEALLDRSNLPEMDRLRLRSELDVLRAVCAFYRMDAEATELHARRGLDTVTLESSLVRSVAWF